MGTFRHRTRASDSRAPRRNRRFTSFSVRDSAASYAAAASLIPPQPTEQIRANRVEQMVGMEVEAIELRERH